MNKKQILKLKTLDNSILSKRSEYSTDSFTKDSFTRDSSILIPPKITLENNEENKSTKPTEISQNTEKSIDHTNKMDDSSVEFDISMDYEPTHKERQDYIKQILFIAKKYWINAILLSIIFYLIFKPSEYKFLLDEIENLKKENTNLQTTPKIENIADISLGASVTDHSKLYSFGLFKLESTDPNSILEPGSSLLSLDGDSGFFEIKFKEYFQIKRIALYHPEKANLKSAMREFSILIGGKRYNFEYCGKGYEEFTFDATDADSIKVEFSNNYGEPSYTCIYRVFVFS